MEQLLKSIYVAQAQFQLETGKTTKAAAQRARNLSNQLTKLYKEFRALSLAENK